MQKALMYNKLRQPAEAFSYDRLGNRLANNDLSQARAYTYDQYQRLVHALYQSSPEETFSYDKVGNRLNGSGVAYTYGSGNRMLTRDAAAYTYDANGNTTSKADGGGGTSYQYDYENRLVKVVLPNGTVAEYKYDALGRRVEKNVNGVVTKYLYDGYNILSEYDDAGNVKARYTHNLVIDDPLAMERDGQVYCYHKDALGSVMSLTDAQGQVVQTYDYDSFGNIASQTGNIENPYTYTGREYDRETGLYYYRARYYDPKAGRFINEDPIGLNGGMNIYQYAGGDPINWVDPHGLKANSCGSRFKKDFWNCVANCLDKQLQTLDPFTILGVISNYGLVPKSIGPWSNKQFLKGGRVGRFWSNQYGKGIKWISVGEAGFAGAAINIAGAFSTGFTVGSICYCYIQECGIENLNR